MNAAAVESWQQNVGEAIHPTAALAALDVEERWQSDPVWVPARQDAAAAVPTSLRQWAESTIQNLSDSGEGTFEIIPAHLSLLAKAVCAELDKHEVDAEPEDSASRVLAAGAQRFAAGLDLSDAARGKLDQELELLLAHGPRADGGRPAGRWLRIDGSETVESLYLDALARHRRAGHEAWLAEVDAVARRLADRLDADRALDPTADSPDALRSGLGGAVGGRIDAAKLASQLPSQRGAARGPKRLGAARRARLERDLDTLEACLVRDRWTETRGPGSALFVRPPTQSILEAIALFDRRAADVAELIVALRRSRLELEDAYDPAVHDAAFARLDWRSFSAHELRRVPPVAVVLDAARWRADDAGLGALSRLLRAARPIHVLITDDGSGVSPNSTFDPGIGYLAMAHREVFVLQSSLTVPDHLLRGLERFVMSSWPALAVIGVPAAERSDLDPWLALEVRRLGRDLPVYSYDPARGETWAERFDLSGNPSPETPWPTLADGQVLTYADAASLDPVWTDHLRPAESEDPRQLPLPEFLDLADLEERAHLVPYVLRSEADGGGRLVLSLDLAFACADRRRAWRLLQELAGTDSEHARRAARAARAEAEAEAEAAREQLEAAHGEELETVRSRAAGEAMDRLVAVLLDVAAAPTTPPASSPRPPIVPEEPVVAPAPQEPTIHTTSDAQVVDGEAFDEEPWVDSVLCTSCDDCIHINAQLFRYNGDHQIEIADPTAGTFEQLVRAAEQCPARCIHPGAPRPGDATANEELITRARAFQ